MLDTPQSFRKDFRQFRTRVLEKAHKDILEFTDIYYTWEPIKKGRAVSWIKFIFGKKQKKAIRANGALQESKPKETPVYLFYEAFLKKFPNVSANRFIAYKVWSELEKLKIAPLAEDVPENNELGIMEFLEEWKNLHS